MEYDKEEVRQRYLRLTTAELVELLRSPRLSAADAPVIEEILEFRGISKTARENLKNPPPVTSATYIADTSYKEPVSRPVFVIVIALFLVWRFIINISLAFSAQTSLPFLYFLVVAIISICIAYGLWGLRQWARRYIIVYCGLIIFLYWFVVLRLFMFADDAWRLSIDELVRSELSGQALTQAVTYKVIFIRACIWSFVYGLITVYFFKPDIRRLFQ